MSNQVQVIYAYKVYHMRITMKQSYYLQINVIE